MLDMAGFAEPGVPVLAHPGIRRWDQFIEMRAAGATKFFVNKDGSMFGDVLSLGTGAASAAGALTLDARVSTGNCSINLRTDSATGYCIHNMNNTSGTLAANVGYGNSTVGTVGLRNAMFFGPRISGEPLLFIADSGATERMRMTSAGAFGIGVSPSAQLHSKATVATNIVATFQGFTSQSADLTEWQDSSGAVLARVTAAGSFGIGGSPVATAILEVASTTKGFLPPRMTTSQRDAISSPAEGLIMYNSTTKKLNFYNGTAWEAVTSI